MASILRQDIRPALKAALEAHAYFSAKAVKAEIDDSTTVQSDAMNTQLDDDGKPGVVIALPPLFTTQRAQGHSAGRRLGEKVVSFLRLRINQQRNAGGKTGAAGFTPDEAVQEVKRVLLKIGQDNQPLQGLEVGQPDPDGITDSLVEDGGRLSWNIWFSVPLYVQPS